MADDICHGCQISEYSDYEDPDWVRKYIRMQWKEGTPANAGTEKDIYEFIQSEDFYTMNRKLRDGELI